jgi:hypothetical protein
MSKFIARRSSKRPVLEALEERFVPSGGFPGVGATNQPAPSGTMELAFVPQPSVSSIIPIISVGRNDGGLGLSFRNPNSMQNNQWEINPGWGSPSGWAWATPNNSTSQVGAQPSAGPLTPFIVVILSPDRVDAVGPANAHETGLGSSAGQNADGLQELAALPAAPPGPPTGAAAVASAGVSQSPNIEPLRSAPSSEIDGLAIFQRGAGDETAPNRAWVGLFASSARASVTASLARAAIFSIPGLRAAPGSQAPASSAAQDGLPAPSPSDLIAGSVAVEMASVEQAVNRFLSSWDDPDPSGFVSRGLARFIWLSLSVITGSALLETGRRLARRAAQQRVARPSAPFAAAELPGTHIGFPELPSSRARRQM